MGTAVVASVYAPPVFELGEHVLDLMALFIEYFVMLDLDFPMTL